jgi:hypothetical protein
MNRAGSRSSSPRPVDSRQAAPLHSPTDPLKDFPQRTARRARSLALATALVLAGCAPPVRGARGPEPAPRWWRGNLHTHSVWSDGNAFPETIADWYRSHGYQFVVMTDHNSVEAGEKWVAIAPGSSRAEMLRRYRERFGDDWVQERDGPDSLRVRLRTLAEYAPKFDEPGRFLVVRGEELSDLIDGKPLHVTVVNAPELIEPRGGATAAEALQHDLDAVREAGARAGVPVVAGVNHPNFYWVATAADIAPLEGLSLFEVYNGSVRVNNEGDATRPGTEAMWDAILTARLRRGLPPVWGTAVDDAHQFDHVDPKVTNPGRGWVMVRADTLTPAALTAALARGDFYASTGVTLLDVRSDGAQLTVEIDAEPGVEYTTEFVGTRRGGGAGEVLATVRGPLATYRLRGDELYVRARVTSSRLKPNGYAPGERERAWTEPTIGTR